MESLTLRPPLYSMNPNFLNLFMKKFTRERVGSKCRGLKFVVRPVPDDLAIDVDRQILAAVVGNLVQNAFKVHARSQHRDVKRACE